MDPVWIRILPDPKSLDPAKIPNQPDLKILDPNNFEDRLSFDQVTAS